MKILTGILSTTHVDRMNDRMTKEALEGGAEQLKETLKPFLINHDWRKLIGVVLYGEVFPLPDGEYALGVVTGIFETDEEGQIFKPGQKNTIWATFKGYLKKEELISMATDNKKGKPFHDDCIDKEMKVADWLDRYLDSTQIAPDGHVYEIKRLVESVGDLKIILHTNDHPPPHFHVISIQRDIDARFSIDTLEVIEADEGKISSNDIKKIQHIFKTRQYLMKKLKDEYLRMKH